MKIETVIFDLDGTLLDTTEGVIESAIYAAKYMGFEELSKETMLNFVGPPIQDSFANYYGCSVADAQKAANIFREYYKNEALLKAVPYDGIFELCENLLRVGKKLSVATYKREDYAKMLLQFFGFDKYCSVMHGADNNNVLTKADIINLCIQETGTNLDSIVIVGDTIYDAIGAQNAGINFIAVTYGFGYKTKEDVKHPNIGVAAKAEEIYGLIV